jgi:hypothetical protein
MTPEHCLLATGAYALWRHFGDLKKEIVGRASPPAIDGRATSLASPPLFSEVVRARNARPVIDRHGRLSHY